MWLVIDPSDTNPEGKGAVISTTDILPLDFQGLYGYVLKEWLGTPPLVHNPDRGIYSYDPTTDDDLAVNRAYFIAMRDSIVDDIAWIDATIPTLPIASLPTIRTIIADMLTRQRVQLLAWQYTLDKLLV